MALHARELTPAGAGAVSVLEVTGEGALDAVRGLAKKGIPEPGCLGLVQLCDAGEELDEALCLVLGPERVELHLHGSPVLLEQVVRALGGGASDGSGTVSLEEEARRTLSGTRSEAAARILLDQAEGALSRHLEELTLLDEARARRGLAELLSDSRGIAAVLVPPRVILAGPTNSGKSTLFNALVGSERAITCEEPGTTRDLVIAHANLDGIDYELVDTAGERETPEGTGPAAVGRAGQAAALALRGSAAVVFWLERAGGAEARVPEGCEVLKTHADRLPEPPPGAVSALADPRGARAVVSERLKASLGLGGSTWVAGRAVLFTPSLCAWAAEVLKGSGSELRGDILARL